jgi:hypothetical protein
MNSGLGTSRPSRRGECVGENDSRTGSPETNARQTGLDDRGNERVGFGQQ